MRQSRSISASLETPRIAWVDYAKGICIILVVMMHATNTVEWHFQQEGWLRPAVDFARPFRMPDFFLISGLFLSRSLNGPLTEYIDRKLLHFIYFYLMWLVIQQSAFETDLLINDPMGFGVLILTGLIDPIGTLWFVHMLAVFYMVTRLLRGVPPGVLLIGAFALQSLFQLGLIDTGWSVADRLANRYVYFCFGFAMAPLVFRFADACRRRPALTLVGLLAWSGANFFAVEADLHNKFLSSAVLGLAGAAAVCAVSSLLAERRIADVLRYCGQHSIVIYLTFGIVLKAALKGLILIGLPLGSAGMASALTLTAGVLLPLIFHRLIGSSRLLCLYERPAVLRLKNPRSRAPATD